MKWIICGLTILFLIGFVSATYVEETDTVSFGHYLRVYEVKTVPQYISPGEEGLVSFKVINNGRGNAENIRIKLILPPELKFYNDVDTVKLSDLNSLESQEVSFRVIAVPGSSEGIYETNLTLDYTSFFAADFANVGEAYQDNFVLGVIIKSDPMIFVEVDESGIYKGNNIGKISVKFVNNNLGDLKFLTVELQESEEYEIISNPKVYVGDLDSDDFESVDFRLKAKKTKENIKLPLKLNYRDSLNFEYGDTFETVLVMHSAEDLGIENNNTFIYTLFGILVIGIGYFLYKKFFKKKKLRQ